MKTSDECGDAISRASRGRVPVDQPAPASALTVFLVACGKSDGASASERENEGCPVLEILAPE